MTEVKEDVLRTVKSTMEQLVPTFWHLCLASTGDGPVVRQARFLCDKNGVATDIPNPDYVAPER